MEYMWGRSKDHPLLFYLKKNNALFIASRGGFPSFKDVFVRGNNFFADNFEKKAENVL